MRSRQHTLTESPVHENPHALLLVPSQLLPAQPRRKPAAASGTCNDSHVNPHRKPNPERDRLTDNPHAVLHVLTTPASATSEKTAWLLGTCAEYNSCVVCTAASKTARNVHCFFRQPPKTESDQDSSSQKAHCL